jgi:biotin operon repressor
MGKFVVIISRWRYKLIVFVSLALLCINCIDPFTYTIEGKESMLVVDALITDEDAANYVKLSWAPPLFGFNDKVYGATVIISDDSGNSVTLQEKQMGEYWTDPTTFRGEVGKSYTLTISTFNGDEYQSSSCMMYPAAEIDSLYYSYYESVPDGYLDYYKGVRIFAETPSESVSGFRRWTYDEWWKFSVPYASTVQYVGNNTVIDIKQRKETCWRHNASSDIELYAEIVPESSGLKYPIMFLPSELSNRFQHQYYVEVKQLSISRTEYEFWKAIKALNETGGDIFDRQPYSVVGNVKNLNNPSKNALGYFQVSSVSSKHIYITNNEIIDMGLLPYEYECDLFYASPSTFFDLPTSFDYMYYWGVHHGYALFEYTGRGLGFVLPFCADCTVSGQLDPPDFWVE